MFHFKPERLKHFRLAYENEDFRVFIVGQPAEIKRLPHPAIYDLSQFHPQSAADGSLRLDISGALSRLRERRQKLFLARLFMRLKRP